MRAPGHAAAVLALTCFRLKRYRDDRGDAGSRKPKGVRDLVETVAVNAHGIAPGARLPDLQRVVTVDDGELRESLTQVLSDLDQTLQIAASGLRGLEVTEIEVALAVTAEGKVGILIGSAAASATASIRVKLKPRGA